MRRAEIYVQDHLAGILKETDDKKYTVTYLEGYRGPPIALTMSNKNHLYTFDVFPPFFEGLLPEGAHLESLLRREKIDRYDYFKQLITVGADLVGDVTVKELP